MARKTTVRRRKKAAKSSKPAKAATRATSAFNEKDLTKGQLRKLNALRKSVGTEIGTRAFGRWLASVKTKAKAPVDRNADMIAGALEPLAKSGKLRIPRGGYLVKRGRGRVIVAPPGA